MQRHTAMICCFLLVAFISLTYVSRAQFLPASGLEEEKFSSRPSPANVTQEPTDTLKEKGYVTIGQISLREEGKSCWGPNCATSLSCPSGSVKKDLTKELLEKAASKGGDLVILSRDNTVIKEGRSKNGKCLVKSPTTKTLPFQKCQSASRDSVTGTYRTGSCTTEMKTVTVNECKAWETIGGYRCAVDSAGTIWRLDPDLGKRIAANISAKNEQRSHLINAEAFVSDTRLDPSAPILVYDNGKWGYRDRNGNRVIPAQFGSARPFAEGLAWAENGTEQGYIDKTGTFVIEGGQFSSTGTFSQGLSAIGIGKEVFKYKYGYIDTKGTFVIPVQFDEGRRFSEGLAAVAVGERFLPERWGFIDRAGKWIVHPSYYDAREFSEGLAPVAIGDILKRKWGYLNKEGVLIIKPAFDDALGFSEDLAPIAVGTLNDKKWGYIDKNGQVVIQPTFSEADTFSEGLAKVRATGKYGFINKKGDFVIKPQFDRASPFVDSEARVLVDSKQAFIDKFGKISNLAQ